MPQWYNQFETFSYENGVDYICLLEAAYNQMITAMNRAIPVAIAVYRWHMYVPLRFIKRQQFSSLTMKYFICVRVS